ncbi:helix-turn-helix transcriptional regulator [Corynebacterium sp.]|uniref:helix-turn-helix domain-containing protein n=1 Tax=Corynebacterium sp. TaxID=1720 RepID=UPI0025C4D2E4|nr:helix-turn-helix transcriptional regulator [Corynebacterium sp.]
MDYRAWIASLPGAPTQTEAAEAASVDKSTLSRQLKRGALSMEVVSALARAHGVKPADALVQTGHLDAEDVEGVGVVEALKYATNRQLFDEIERRSDMESTTLFGKGPGVINPRPALGVVPPASDTPDGVSGEQDKPENDTPSVHSDRHDLDEVLRKANQLKGAAQRRTPRIEEPENP